MKTIKNNSLAKIAIVTVTIALIILIVAVVLIIKSKSNSPSLTPGDASEMQQYDSVKNELKNKLDDANMAADVIMIGDQVEKYIFENQDKERNKPYLYEINLITKSDLFVRMDEDPKPGFIIYNSKSDCDGQESDVSFSVSAFRRNGSLYCID